jgi:hypothetical protein
MESNNSQVKFWSIITGVIVAPFVAIMAARRNRVSRRRQPQSNQTLEANLEQQQLPTFILDTPVVDTKKLLQEISSGQKDCLYQEQSPLFQLPPEIRNEIFQLVVAEQDGKTEISKDAFFYRPNYTHFRYMDTALLITCKRAWVEGWALPRQGIVRMKWLTGGDRAPRRLLYSQAAGALAELKTSMDIPNFFSPRIIHPCQTLQVFAQMYRLEMGGLAKLIADEKRQGLPLRHLILTLRYTDWWNWEVNQPLRIQNHWATTGLRLPDTIEKVTMEFETRNGKKGEMHQLIANQIQDWELSTETGAKLVLEDEREETKMGESPSGGESWRRGTATMMKKVHVKTWVGSNIPGGGSYRHHSQEANGTRDLNDGEMLYSVATMVWKKTEPAHSNVSA